MRTLLHVSDVHFGPRHLPRQTEGVLELIAELQPSLLVVSGDLTQRARPYQFQQARAFVDRVEGEGVPVLAVPGNHDVPLWRVWERALAPYDAWRTHFDPELEPHWYDDELFVVGVNTAHGWTTKEGRIRRSRLHALEARLSGAPESATKVVVAHHELIPPPRFSNQQVLVNAPEAVALLAALGVELVLSGHCHQAYLGTSQEYYPHPDPPVLILHSGTTTSSRGRGGERGENSCNVVRIGAGEMEVSMLRWAPQQERFRVRSRHVFPRGGSEPYILGS